MAGGMIAACADIHLGAGTDYGPKPGDRLADQRKVWRGACEATVKANAPMLIAGDVFHRARPTMGEMDAYRDGLRILREASQPVLVITGNHDVSHQAEPTGMDILDGDGVTVVRQPGIHHIGGWEVACLPWSSMSQYVANRGGGDRDQARSEFAKLMVDIAGGLRAQCESQDPILMLHWTVTNAVGADGTPTSVFRDVILDARELEAQGWQWCVAGHIHRHQRFFPPDPAIVPSGFYTGSLTTVDFSEADIPHGFVFLQNSLLYATVEDRRFVTLDLDDSEADEFDDSVEGAVVRVRYTDREGMDPVAIRKRLYELGAHKVYAIQVTTPERERVRVEHASEQMSIPEALEMWMVHDDTPEPLRGPMRDKTTTYLEEGP